MHKSLAKHGKTLMMIPHICRPSTVVAASFAHLFLDSPTLIAMYYLPYKNGEVKKFVLY